jgi:hypothetical protein
MGPRLTRIVNVVSMNKYLGWAFVVFVLMALLARGVLTIVRLEAVAGTVAQIMDGQTEIRTILHDHEAADRALSARLTTLETEVYAAIPGELSKAKAAARTQWQANRELDINTRLRNLELFRMRHEVNSP